MVWANGKQIDQADEGSATEKSDGRLWIAGAKRGKEGGRKHQVPQPSQVNDDNPRALAWFGCPTCAVAFGL